MARKLHSEVQVVDDLDDIPVFSSEAEEAAYWGTHALSEKLLESMHALSDEDAPRPRKSRAISLRIDEGLLDASKLLQINRIDHINHSSSNFS